MPETVKRPKECSREAKKRKTPFIRRVGAAFLHNSPLLLAGAIFIICGVAFQRQLLYAGIGLTVAWALSSVIEIIVTAASASRMFADAQKPPSENGESSQSGEKGESAGSGGRHTGGGSGSAEEEASGDADGDSSEKDAALLKLAGTDETRQIAESRGSIRQDAPQKEEGEMRHDDPHA